MNGSLSELDSIVNRLMALVEQIKRETERAAYLSNELRVEEELKTPDFSDKLFEESREAKHGL